MEPARIALARRISSDSIDSFGAVKNPRSIRKGKRRGAKRSSKTKITDLRGDDLRTPPSPHSEGPRHSDRSPDKRVRALRDDVTASDNEAALIGKKRSHRERDFRRTRSLSPQSLDRQRPGATDLLRWKPMELLSVKELAGLRKQRSQGSNDEQREGDESSLGSLIEAIEAEFGGQHEMPVYHQSTSSLPAVPIYCSDDQLWAGNEKLFRFSPDADALLSLSSANGTSKGHDTDTSGSMKSVRKPSIGKDANNASMGTLSTATSTLSFEDAVVDLFTALKPPSLHSRPDPPAAPKPPSLDNPKDPGIKEKKTHDSPKKKKQSAKKNDSGSVASSDSRWLELVTPLNPKNSSTSISTVGEVKGYKVDSSGTINSMESEEMKKQLKEEMGGKSMSALDVGELLSPTKKKDLLRVSAHCSPTQVSKHAGLSVLSAHTQTSSSNRSMSSAYLLERLPLDPPITDKSTKKSKRSSSSPRKSKKESTVSVDRSVEEFEPPKKLQRESKESEGTGRSSDAGEVYSAQNEKSTTNVRPPRRGRRPGKKETNVLATTLAMLSPDPGERETITRRRHPPLPSDASNSGSVELFTPVRARPTNGCTEERSSEDTGVARVSSEAATALPANNPCVSSIPTETGNSTESVANGLTQEASTAQDKKMTSIPICESACSENTGQPHTQQQRRNPPARPWGGRTSICSESLVSSIKELSVGPVEEESMLNVLISSIKKDKLEGTKENDYKQSEVSDESEQQQVVIPPQVTNDPECVTEAMKQPKSPKSKKKHLRKAKSSSTCATSPVSSPYKETDLLENIEAPLQDDNAVTVKSASRTKTPNAQKTPGRVRKSIDASVIPCPPLTTQRRKTPTRSRKMEGPDDDDDDAAMASEDASPRRRTRPRRHTFADGAAAASAGRKTPTRVRPGSDDGTAPAGRKTPRHVRPGAEDSTAPAGRTSPRRARPGAEDSTAPVGKKTPTRVRPGPEDIAAPVGKRSPTRVRPVSESGIVGRKTPTRLRLGEEGMTPAEGTTPPRLRPRQEEGFNQAGRKTPTRVRPGTDDRAVSTGKKTPTRVRPGVEEESAPVRRKLPTRSRPDHELNANDGGRPKTPTKARTTVDVELRRKQTPVRIRRTMDATTSVPDIPEACETSPVREWTAPDPPAAMPEILEQPRSPDPPAATFGTKDGSRTTTPTRVRRIFDAAAERVASVCRTPPRERKTLPPPSEQERRTARERSFSPFARLRLLGSRTPPRERPSEKSESPRPERRVVSQSPPRERLVRNTSCSLSPVPRRLSSQGLSTPQKVETPSQRPSSRGRRRLSASESKTEDKGFEITRPKTPTRIHRSSFGSQNSSSSRPKTPTSLRRKLGDAPRETAESDAASTRSRTPTRARRRIRVDGKNEGDRSKREQPIGKVSIRPRRRGGDRESFSGTAPSEKATLPALSPLNGDSPTARRKTPTRGRPSTRPQTPTMSRKKRPALPRYASERRFQAPDPPGDSRSKKRAQSVNKSRRSRSQTRSRSCERTPMSSTSMHHEVDNHPLAEFFD